MNPFSEKLHIMYEDNHLLCAIKPQNMPVAEDSSRDFDLLNGLKQYIKEAYQKPGAVFLGLVHRLDRPAGGVMVFARTSKAAARLSDAMRTGQFEKTYLAIVCGQPPHSGTLVDHISRDEQSHSSAICAKDAPGAKEARLSFETIARAEGLSMVKIQLYTGRHHQIRVQFAHAGFPLFGDARYNPQSKPGQQLALWAATLAFPHPISKERVQVEAEPPGIFPWTAFAGKTLGDIPILYKDSRVLALDKPAGMEVEGDLSERVQRVFPAARPCHRLDANTTGVVLFALTDEAYDAITRGMEQRRIQKTYRCVVRGVPSSREGIFTAWLKKDAEAAKVSIFDHPVPGAKEIVTGYRVEQVFADSAVLSVQLITGRTHQIRAHLAHLGHPILGDDKYGDRAFNKEAGVARQLLRAVSVFVDLPNYGMTIDCEWDF